MYSLNVSLLSTPMQVRHLVFYEPIYRMQQTRKTGKTVWRK